MRRDQPGGQMPRRDQGGQRLAQIRLERHAMAELRHMDQKF